MKYRTSLFQEIDLAPLSLRELEQRKSRVTFYALAFFVGIVIYTFINI